VLTSSITAPNGRARTAGFGFYSAFLNAQGRVLHDVFVYPDTNSTGDDFLVEVDAAQAERLVRYIERRKLRARFEVRLLDEEERGVWHAWDDNGGEGGRALEAVAGMLERGSGGRRIVVRDPRSPTLGFRVVGEAPVTPKELGLELDEVDESTYQVRRYLHGVPEGPAEILFEQALPLESNLDVMGGVDFHKGCYVGQELTIRTKHRGVVRKRILPCLLYGEGAEDVKVQDRELAYRPAISSTEGGGTFASAEDIPAGTSIGRLGKKGPSAGKWLRGVGNVGLALCRLQIMTDVVLPGEASSATTFNPEDEFVLEEKLEDGQEGVGRRARVKAFVPLWLRQGLDGATPRP
jgi:folate-binding protein YgfZ